ncbi:antibiotic biosynthesis monooxygenase family protein [Lederbergia wuyishanensis]|uniref:Heme-degrading monooxygenase HmoA n=1 Tax=Lederbergia wuyishanensis TaxID=1347903 RepID=A0ABU0CYQ7_9BACI|nr:antibiotic biosynthesis monooxygenase [Lederbergia wuyishanensis]MCJ8005912.1 antibiotic biosynthesis monooxygenase [Lederbergia wuyishanensis]MDQ0341277.1 heme-degrading monooxygenase HmoA [Lederbergia wuyishanensis]
MYVYIAMGTHYFLKKLEEKYSNEKMVLMQNVEGCLLWHETTGSTVFQSPKKYELLEAVGEFENEGVVSCNFIPIRDENRPIFEYGMADKIKLLQNENGFITARFLRPLTNDTYLLMTMWNDEEHIRTWKNSSLYHNLHFESKGSNIFSGSSYSSIYFVNEEKSVE